LNVKQELVPFQKETNPLGEIAVQQIFMVGVTT